MKEKIEQLAKGKFEYQLPQLLLSEEKLVIRAEAGRIYRGCFCISNSKNRRMKGVIYSDSLLLELEKEQFVGEENEIPFVFHAEHGGDGERYEGKLRIVTDIGEAGLAYEAVVRLPQLLSSAGEIHDLFQFAGLAKENWAGAEELFFDSRFGEALFCRAGRQRVLYRMLAGTKTRGHALEEFLVAAGKKKPVRVSAQAEELSYRAAGYPFMDKLVFQKDEWGFVCFELSCSAAFISLTRTSFSSEDFVNGCAEIEMIVNPSGLGPGLHRAVIRAVCANQTLEIPVCCAVEHKNPEQKEQRRRRRRAQAGLTENYLLFRSGQRNVKQYIAEAERCLTLFRGEDAEPAARLLTRLYQIHIWQVSGKESAAGNALTFFDEPGQRELLSQYPDAEGGLYYLQALQKKPPLSPEDASERLAELYEKHPDRWLLLWYLLYIKKEYQDRKKRLEAIRGFSGRNGWRPVLLFEALAAVREDVSLLSGLGTFELAILQFALSLGYFGSGLQSRVAYLAAREKSMSALLYRVLVRCYEQKPDRELLEAICALIIRSGSREPRYFRWFQLGAEAQLRLAELPEFYMSCLNDESAAVIDPGIYAYFGGGAGLSDRKRARLYADVIRHKEQNPALYQKFRGEIGSFAGERLRAGSVSSSLAVIYSDIFQNGPESEEEARALPQIAFTWRISCRLEAMRSVCVRHPDMEQSEEVPFVGGRAYIRVYTEDAEICLKDAYGDLYPLQNLCQEQHNAPSGGAEKTKSAAPVQREKLLELDEYLWKSYEAGCSDTGLLLYLAEQVFCYQKYGEQKQELLQRIAVQDDISGGLRNRCVLELTDYYYENCESELFEHYLRQIDLEELEAAQRAKFIGFLITRGFDAEAAGALQRYGTEGVEGKRLAKLAERLLAGGEAGEFSRFLLFLSRRAFDSGKYDGGLLEYLCRFYHGSTRSMYDIWKAARNAELDTEALEESLLGQMLFAESYIGNAQTVFMSYYRYGTNRLLIRAYLNYHAYKYLTKDRALPDELFEIMEREAGMEENDICTAALLRRYSEAGELTERQNSFIGSRLHILLKKGIILPFYRSFEHITELPGWMYDKYFVEYRTDPESIVKIHYRIGDGEEFREAKMQNAFCGIFVYGFILFGEESLQYYITEETDGEEKLTESTTVTREAQLPDGRGSRFDNLNLILTAHQMKEEAAVLSLLESYIRTEHEAAHLFRPISD